MAIALESQNRIGGIDAIGWVLIAAGSVVLAGGAYAAGRGLRQKVGT